MPAIDPNSNRNAPKARAKVKPAAAPKPVKVRVTVPDAGDPTRTTRPHTVTPDQADRQRGPVQQAKDTAAVKQSVQTSRVKALRKEGRGSGTRTVKAWVKGNVSDEKNAKTTDVHGHHGSGPFAVIAANLPVAGFSAKVFKNAAKDAAELAVTTPSSVAKLASDVVHHPGKVPGELAQPYIDFAKHPLKTAEEKPVSTALMLQPAGRVPGRVVGKVARVAGKQTLERTPATLPGTALQEARTGSRDFFVRKHQEKKDAANPAPEVTAKQVQERVDHHVNQAKHEAARIESEHVGAAKRATRGQPKDVREAAVTQARETAREVADHEGQVRFAQEFGANVKLSHGVAVREALHHVRRQAVGHLDAARVAERAASTAHDAALGAYKTARARVRTSGKLSALEFTRRDVQKNLVAAERAHATARVGLGVAKGRAAVLTRTVTGRSTPRNGVWGGGGHGVRLAQDQVDAAATAVRTARDRVRQLDSDISAEQQRLRKVVPLAQHQALTAAIHTRGQARVALATARADAHVAAHAHIAAKRAMTNANLVDPAGEGRLFAHKADAATVVRRLNQAATAAGAEPATFVLRQVGDDRWAAVPQVAAQRLTKHRVVGSSPATMAKLMRVSRGAFTNAVLPLSAKWLAGQGAEAGIRAAVAGAGPMDWLRMGKVVKRLNEQRPGSGDELAMRVSGGHFDLTGPARDFANGKSLAEEFEGTPLAKPANVASAVGGTAPMSLVRSGWGKYTRAVLGTINHVIEQNTRRAMAGQAVKDLGFDERHILGLSDRAIEDAVNGLRGTHNQVALARAVDRMYGKYQGFSPEMRSFLMHWTPFLPWYINTTHFLLRMLPVDHPVKAALLADTSVAEEDWRKSHGLDPWEPGHVPNFLLGSYPNGNGKFQRIAHYTPWGIGSDPTGAVGSLLLPQVSGPIFNAAGVDWKGDPLTRGGSHGPKFNTGEKAARVVTTALEEQIPGVSQAGAISGITPRFVDKDNPEDIKKPGEVAKGYLPWTPTSNNQSATGSSGGSSGRVKIPGGATGGRVKLPGGATGRIKIP